MSSDETISRQSKARMLYLQGESVSAIALKIRVSSTRIMDWAHDGHWDDYKLVIERIVARRVQALVDERQEMLNKRHDQMAQAFEALIAKKMQKVDDLKPRDIQQLTKALESIQKIRKMIKL